MPLISIKKLLGKKIVLYIRKKRDIIRVISALLPQQQSSIDLGYSGHAKHMSRSVQNFLMSLCESLFIQCEYERKDRAINPVRGIRKCWTDQNLDGSTQQMKSMIENSFRIKAKNHTSGSTLITYVESLIFLGVRFGAYKGVFKCLNSSGTYVKKHLAPM